MSGPQPAPPTGGDLLGVADAHAVAVEVAFFERACAHVLAGWAPKVSDLDIKLTLGAHLGRCMEIATAFRRRANSLTAGSGLSAESESGRIPQSWSDLIATVDRSPNVEGVMSGVYLVITQGIVTRLRRYLERSDPIADDATRRMSLLAIAELTGHIEWAKQIVADGPVRMTSAQRRIAQLWENRSSADMVESSGAPLAPIDRLPEVARPPGMRRGALGAVRVLPMNPLDDPRDIGIFLHNFLNEEITTMELVCRNTYEHPEMPWQFHADCARHVEDESRHARLVWRAARLFGVEYGDFPIYTSSYEGQYQFAPCEVGSSRELLWRLLLRQTFHEGLALDSLAFEVRKRRFLHQDELARMFEFLLADEVFHARSGLTWSRFLCDGDEARTNLERDNAHAYFVNRVKETRARFVAENPDQAVAEVDTLERMERMPTLPFERELNTSGRKAAGFTEDEIEQVVTWGYVKHSAPEAASPSSAE